MTEFRNVRLQPPQRQITTRESWRQANNAELWHGHAWLLGLRNANVAVCVLPGTELSFSSEIACQSTGLFGWRNKVMKHTTAIFRQVNVHHDALEFADGQIVLLTLLAEGQQATVLQLPAEPKCADDFEKQKRAAYVG
jgi:hypothetical protein